MSATRDDKFLVFCKVLGMEGKFGHEDGNSLSNGLCRFETEIVVIFPRQYQLSQILVLLLAMYQYWN